MTAPLAQLEARLADRTATVAVIGLGYVGLPLADAFARADITTLGFDIDPAKPEAIAKNHTYLTHLGPSFVADLNATGNFTATTDFTRLSEPDAVLICVPTPLDDAREPDLSYVERTARDIAAALRPGQLVVLESTTYPGTTRDLLAPILETSGLTPSVDFWCAFSPEREDPGRGLSPAAIPKLVGGLSPASTTLAATLYRLAFARVVETSSAEVAESAKLLENIYRAVNIALVNELKLVLDRLDVPVHEVIEAAATKPFGFQRFDPGPGLGGHCIPIDPYYLAWRAKQAGVHSRFIELAGDVNHAMPQHVVDRTAGALRNAGKDPARARILVLGLAYKKNIGDVRESPALEIIELLQALGARVDYHDPHVPATHKMRRHDLNMASVPLTPEALAAADAVVVVTDHDAIDWALVAAHASLIVDTRHAIAAVPATTTLVRA